METPEMAWRKFAEEFVCKCTSCRDGHKASFMAGAFSFWWNMAQIERNPDGSTDLGPYVDAARKEFDAHFAEMKSRPRPEGTIQH
jgi:deoxyribodipyrimidine photolyase